VFAYFNELLYEGKCVKRRKTDDGNIEYFIHYIGWNNKWDEWVDSDDVLEVNEINLGHMERLKTR